MNGPEFEFAGAAFPAQETGGGYFDFVALPDGRYAAILGDVAGHGIGPALLMAETRALLRAFGAVPQDDDVTLVIVKVN